MKTPSKIIPADVPWSDTAVLVCTKCGKKLEESGRGEGLSDAIKKELKSKVKNENRSHEIRVMTSSCLDICPDDQIAIVVADKSRGFQGFTVDPHIPTDELFAKLLSK